MSALLVVWGLGACASAPPVEPRAPLEVAEPDKAETSPHLERQLALVADLQAIAQAGREMEPLRQGGKDRKCGERMRAEQARLEEIEPRIAEESGVSSYLSGVSPILVQCTACARDAMAMCHRADAVLKGAREEMKQAHGAPSIAEQVRADEPECAADDPIIGHWVAAPGGFPPNAEMIAEADCRLRRKFGPPLGSNWMVGTWKGPIAGRYSYTPAGDNDYLVVAGDRIEVRDLEGLIQAFLRKAK